MARSWSKNPERFQKVTRLGLLVWMVLTVLAWSAACVAGWQVPAWGGEAMFYNLNALVGAAIGVAIAKDSARGFVYGAAMGLVVGYFLKCGHTMRISRILRGQYTLAVLVLVATS